MPSTLHQPKRTAEGRRSQGILADPWLAFDILGIPHPVDGIPIDRRGEVEYDGEEALKVNQGFPEVVMVYQDPDDDTRGVVITVEAQKQPNVEERDELMEIERESGTYFVGHQVGLERGSRQALAELTLSLLAERGIAVDAKSEARIRGCEELSVLQRLARRAFDASSIDELFD